MPDTHVDWDWQRDLKRQMRPKSVLVELDEHHYARLEALAAASGRSLTQEATDLICDVLDDDAAAHANQPEQVVAAE